MTAHVSQDLFPLRLETFDQMMLDDDHPRYPMTYLQVVEFSGQVNEPAFVEALRGALARHPILVATLGIDRKNRRVWQLNPHAAPPVVDFGDMSEPLIPPPRSRIKLASEPGVRTYVRSNAERTQATFLFHHACTDGMGSYRFIGDLLTLYAQATGTAETQPVLTPLEPDRMKIRSQTMMHGPDRNCKTVSWTAMLAGFVRDLATSEAAKLAPPRRANFDESLQPFPGAVKKTYDQKQFHAIRKAAEKLGVFPNDLILGATFKIMAQWNKSQGRVSDKPFRIMMPTDLRGKGDELMPAANVVSLAFLERHANQCESNGELIDFIRQETMRIKGEVSGTEFIQALTLAYAVPGIVGTCLRGNGALASAMVSNTGDPTRRFTNDFPRSSGKLVCGNLVMENIYGMPPLRRGTRLNLSVQAYNRCLTITTRTDPYRFNLEETEEFLKRFDEQLMDLVSFAG